MAVEKGNLEAATHSIGCELILVIGQLHKWSDNESVPGHIVQAALEKLLTIHGAIKVMEPTCKGIDELLATLGGRALAPRDTGAPKPTEDKA